MNTDEMIKFTILKLKKAQLEEQIKMINVELDKLGSKIFDQFADEGLESCRLSYSKGGVVIFKDERDRIITPDTSYKPSVPKEKTADFHKWLRDNERGDMIKESVHPTTLKAFVKNLREQNKPLPPKELLSVWEVPTAKVKLAPAKKK